MEGKKCHEARHAAVSDGTHKEGGRRGRVCTGGARRTFGANARGKLKWSCCWCWCWCCCCCCCCCCWIEKLMDIQIAQSQWYSSSELALKLLHSKSYARLQTKKGAHQPLIIVRKIPDQVTSAVHAWLAVRRPHATTPGDDGLSMASGGTRTPQAGWHWGRGWRPRESNPGTSQNWTERQPRSRLI